MCVTDKTVITIVKMVIRPAAPLTRVVCTGLRNIIHGVKTRITEQYY